jgi:hypothetical protein
LVRPIHVLRTTASDGSSVAKKLFSSWLATEARCGRLPQQLSYELTVALASIHVTPLLPMPPMRLASACHPYR